MIKQLIRRIRILILELSGPCHFFLLCVCSLGSGCKDLSQRWHNTSIFSGTSNWLGHMYKNSDMLGGEASMRGRVYV